MIFFTASKGHRYLPGFPV